MNNKIITEINKYKEMILCDTREIRDIWINLQNEIDILPVYYQVGFMEYQESYFKEKCDNYVSVPIIIKLGNNYVGIWSLLILYRNNKWEITTCGGGILQPVFADKWNLSVKKKRSIYRIIMSFLKQISRILDIEKLNFSNYIMEGCDEWHRFLMENNGLIDSATHECFYNLDLDLNIASKKLHKSTMQRIKEGLSLYDYRIITKKDEDVEYQMDRFRQFHIKIAGRETRGKETWKKQLDSIMESDDFIVKIIDKVSGDTDGYALFSCTNSWCYYAVAAYNREKFDKPLGHVAQYAAINRLRELNLKWYDIGERFYGCDGVDEKMLAISLYKESFATDYFIKLHVLINV